MVDDGRRTRDPKEAAQAVAADMLGWLMARPEDAGRWLAMTGLDPEALRAAVRSGDPEFLAGVVDFVFSDETLAEAYAVDRGVDPEEMRRVRARLPGGDEPNWL